eukprot:CAMPEP_0179106766 /NCGR_PEP_ID=MMETSP0796-20121207/49660_1 /TAXON_ID=73915 /ORGANISM="Pyrodinium bahamense, Strain pbaha01" /LENGTH=463 /DNA_ID=CAMNT_0020804809 /DNA_START=23 /DNA_END=1414 /DNA_ORIENTATION=-
MATCPVLLAPLLLLGAGATAWLRWLQGSGGHAPQQIYPLGDVLLAVGADSSNRSHNLRSVQPAAPSSDKWDALRQLLSSWEFTSEYAVSVGDAEHGRLFLYEGGRFKMRTRIPTGSTSKWPSAMMFAGLVNDGTVASLDDPVFKYLSWWTKDPKDLRSTVTFRMLLSFTSGFGDGHPGEEGNSRAARQWRSARNVSSARRQGLYERLRAEVGEDAATKCDANRGDIMECARSIYENVKLIGVPGKVYSYNSNHLQLAAAVSVATTGLGIQEVIQKYLIKPYGMASSLYLGKCPDFGGSLITTGDDYERFLAALLSYKTLSKSIVDASEEDSTPFLSSTYTLYGDYGFGHFLMCFDSVDGFTEKCRSDMCHMDPGAFGFIPIIDRKRQYYFQVVAAEIPPTGSYPLSGIPEYLAVAIKPHVDAIMSARPPAGMEHLSHNPEFLSLSVADVNYCLNCKLHPRTCS